MYGCQGKVVHAGIAVFNFSKRTEINIRVGIHVSRAQDIQTSGCILQSANTIRSTDYSIIDCRSVRPLNDCSPGVIALGSESSARVGSLVLSYSCSLFAPGKALGYPVTC